MQLHVFSMMFLVYSMTSCSGTEVKRAGTENLDWVYLFDGGSLDGWHGFNKSGAVENWMVEDSMLVCLGVAEHDFGGDLVTDREYKNFELKWEWKLEAGANTGVMYHVVEDSRYLAPYETGPEYQLNDDSAYSDEPSSPLQETGADYEMYAANSKKRLNPVGQWNSSKIVFNGGQVTHWLNGEKIVEFEAWSDDWNERRENSKWQDFPDYGKARSGKIALQDHGTKAWFRNIMIREL